jgi:histidinol-phosphate aminotransferase
MPIVRPNIAAMHGYVPGEQPRGQEFIKLNTNECPYPCSPAVKASIGRVLQVGLQRYPDPMATAFRERAAALLAAEAPGITPDWILCGNGSDDILTILTRTFVSQGELLRFPYPSYILYRSLAEIQGATWEEVDFNSDWSLPAAFSKPNPKLKLAILPNPNSPTGTVIPPTEVTKLSQSLNCPLLVDEAYADFADSNCIDLVKECENVLVSRSFSKAYSLAGLRFGYVVAQPHIVQELLKVKDSYNCDALSIAGATAAIDDQAWRVDNRAKIIATRTRLTEQLTTLGFSVIPSQANFVWCEHRERPPKPLYEALKQQRILVRYMNYPKWREGLRISIGDDSQTDALLAVLKTLV